MHFSCSQISRPATRLVIPEKHVSRCFHMPVGAMAFTRLREGPYNIDDTKKPRPLWFAPPSPTKKTS
eukprot:jgi/Chrzof1/13229/Cz07g25140.t1